MLSKFKIFRLGSCALSTTAANFKISTGISGLKADPYARSNLLKLYSELKEKLYQLPEDYAYRKGMLAIVENRNNLLRNEAFSDLDVENEIGEGQLEELIDQAKDEIKLLEKVSNEWQPWEK
mgnify:CR=1 FL=1